MIYLNARISDDETIGLMLSYNANHTTKGMIKGKKVTAIDNGCFSKPDKYTDDGYLLYLQKLDLKDSLFAVAPDVVGDYKKTRERAYPMFDKIKNIGYKVAYVGQDGEDGKGLDFSVFDCLFLGGTTDWKLGGQACELVALARQHKKWVHMGRVNSYKRMRVAGAIGVDSVDGTYTCWKTKEREKHLAEWITTIRKQPYLELQ